MVYSYSELKGKIKIGDEVRAVKGKQNPCDELEQDGSNIGIITEVKDDFFCINGCCHYYCVDDFLDLLSTEKTYDNLQVGDEIDCGDDVIRVVLETGSTRNAFLLSSTENDYQSLFWYSRKEMDIKGWKIKQPEPPKEDVQELTVEEVSKLVGKTVKIVEKK